MCGTRENLVEVLDQVLGGTLQAPGSMTLFPQVQLSESKRELTELRSALRVLQKEKEQLQAEKQVRLNVQFKPWMPEPWPRGLKLLYHLGNLLAQKPEYL